MRKPRFSFDIVLMALLAPIALLPLASEARDTRALSSTPPTMSVGPGDRVLVVSPHPDDESLCCGGFVHQAIAAGAHVSIVWITSGDGFGFDAAVVNRTLRPRRGDFRDLGRRRIGEAKDAAGLLGVSSRDLYFLDYPDRGIFSLVTDYYYTPWQSRYTGSSTVLGDDAMTTGADYSGLDLERDFRGLIDRIDPTLVLAPSPRDSHSDHRATGILTLRAMGARNQLDRVRYWIVHGGRFWPARGLRPELAQTAPPRGAGMAWTTIPIGAAARDAKRAALNAHATQMKVMGGKMMAYVRSTELFSATPMPSMRSPIQLDSEGDSGETEDEDDPSL